MSFFLAYDGGGTTTRAGLYTADRALVAETTGGPCNPVDVGLSACVATLAALAGRLVAAHPGPLAAVAAGVSGAGKVGYGTAIGQALCRDLGAARVVTTNDVRGVLFANAGAGAGILAVAGTGSCVVGQAADGREATAGGRGTFFGDEGSAYQIVAGALRAVAGVRDGLGPATRLEGPLIEAIQADHEGAAGLTAWAASATKYDVAQLCPIVATVAEQGDPVARDVVATQACRLAAQVGAVYTRLALPAGTPVFLIGGVLENCAPFRTAFEAALLTHVPAGEPTVAPLRGHRAVVELALADPPPSWAVVCTAVSAPDDGAPATEQRMPGPRTLDVMSADEIVRTMNREDALVPEAVARQAPALAAATAAAAAALQSGGRLIYIGAGTSGRLGVLDAAECPPTFGVSPDRVVALIAGGERALRASVEDAEDNTARAAEDIRAIAPAVGAHDVVVGIAASGRTPYVQSALDTAKARGARTVLVCCVDAPAIDADIIVALNTGPEVVAGSTRLKAGTATKLALNTISTGAMALAGYVYEGLMVGVQPVNEKLRRRALNIVAALTGLEAAAAGAALAAAGDRIPVAVVMVREQTDVAEAEIRLRKAGGSLRAALEGE